MAESARLDVQGRKLSTWRRQSSAIAERNAFGFLLLRCPGFDSDPFDQGYRRRSQQQKCFGRRHEMVTAESSDARTVHRSGVCGKRSSAPVEEKARPTSGLIFRSVRQKKRYGTVRLIGEPRRVTSTSDSTGWPEPLPKEQALDEKSLADSRRSGSRGGSARAGRRFWPPTARRIADGPAITSPAATQHNLDCGARSERTSTGTTPTPSARACRTTCWFSVRRPTFRIFQERRGTTFDGSLSSVRIEQTRHLLTSTALTITRGRSCTVFSSPSISHACFVERSA